MSSKAIITWLFTHLLPYKKYVFIAISALLLSSLAWLLLGQGIKYVVDEGFVANDKIALRQSLIGVILVVFLAAVSTYFRFYWMLWLGERVCADIRKKLFCHLLSLPPSFFENTKTGEIISRFTSDTTLLQSVVGTSISMALRSSVMLIGALVLMAFTSPLLTLLVFIAVPLMLVPIKVFGKKVRLHTKRSQDKVANVGGMIDEALHEIHTVQSYNHQQTSIFEFGDKIEQVMQQASKRIHFRALLIAFVMLLSMSAIFIVAYIGALMVIDQKISMGELSAFVFYAVLAGGAIATVSEVLGELQKAAGASERIFELLNQASSLPDEGSAKLTLDEINNPTIAHAIEVKNLSFSYPGSSTKNLSSTKESMLIKSIDFRVSKGQRLAIVGHSGAGKSTIFELLLRFYDTNQGEIKLFGHNIKKLRLDTVRSLFALVPQDPVIFSGSVSENIAFSDPLAGPQEIQDAAKLAYAEEFISLLPEQYSTDLGERGVKLSGGQKQRIAIARAILSKRPILLLDEATSALDASSEQYLKNALEHLMQNKTTLIIAHRLSTVVNADEILVLDKGEIVARGSHQSLYKQSPIYKEFVDLQLVEEQ